MNKQQAMVKLHHQIEQIDNIKRLKSGSQEFNKWHRDTEVAIEKIFGADSKHVAEFNDISYSLAIFTSGTQDYEFENAHQGGLDTAKTILMSFADEIKEYWNDNEQHEVAKIVSPSQVAAKDDKVSKKKTIKENIEDNITLWMLGILLTGFIAGLATYDGALRIMRLETISKDRLKTLETNQLSSVGNIASPSAVPLPAYLSSSKINVIQTTLRQAFNEKNVHKLYAMLGPLAKSQLTESAASLQMNPLFTSLGKISDSFYVQYAFTGQQGPNKGFMLNYFAKYEKAERGIINVGVIDDGKDYQIVSMMFSAM